jgi:transcriptional regulator with XRE-family HTH domain
MTLREVRRRANMTQTELAKRLGIEQSAISRIERGETRSPSHRLVMAICRVLGVDPHEIDEFQDGGRR